MTKEEYKKNLIRMWDSLRTEHKGEENCVGVACGDCPLYNKQPCGPLSAFEAIEFVEKWAKEHKIVTNADKFKEMFGVEYGECKVDERFWNAEYTEPAESEE